MLILNESHEYNVLPLCAKPRIQKLTKMFKSHITPSLLALSFLLLQSQGGQVSSEQIIASPRITGWGKWATWEYCADGYFVDGMQLRTEAPRGAFLDDRGLTGIRLFCNTYGQNTQDHPISSATDSVGSWGQTYFCEGLMTAFQMRSEKSRSAFIDDTAGNNLRMFCDQKDGQFHEGDGTSFGTWTPKQVCGPKEAVCGIATQIDNSDSWDRTGLNNVMMKCCDIPHPVKSCVPTTTWKLVASCGVLQLNSTTDKTCIYNRKIGISYLDGLSSPTKLLNEKMGYGISSTSSQLHSKFLIPKDDHRHWQSSPNYVWEPQISSKASISATKDSKVMLYQLHGTCGLNQVWGTKLKKVKHFLNAEGTEQVSETFVDFTNDEEDSDYTYEH